MHDNLIEDPIWDAIEKRIEKGIRANSEKPPPNQKLQIKVIIVKLHLISKFYYTSFVIVIYTKKKLVKVDLFTGAVLLCFH